MRVSRVSPLPDKLLKKQNKQTKQRQIHRYREQTDGCQTGGGLGTWWKGEGIKKYKLAVTEQTRGCKVVGMKAQGI